MPSTNHTAKTAPHSTQDEARAVRDLMGHSQDYHRLPRPLQALVEALEWLESAGEVMVDARRTEGLAPSDAPSPRMLLELSYLVEHTRDELRRHGVVEGALAWLASHPEGWDDEPEYVQALPEYVQALPEGADSCPSCGGALASTITPLISKCLACGVEWS